ncbi:hypothetical protein NTE05_005230 [Vibrio harveyi]|nr:hypothetical protein [Vibrio harveyi]
MQTGENMQRQMDRDELAYFYHSVGKAIWHMQYVEQTLGQMLLIMGRDIKPNSLDPEEAESMLLSVQKKTLGAIINEVVKKSLLPAELENRLEKFNSERRWLVHKSVIENSDDLYNTHKRADVFERIDAFTNEAIQLNKDLLVPLDEHIVSIGLHPTEFAEKAEQEIRALKGFA